MTFVGIGVVGTVVVGTVIVGIVGIVEFAVEVDMIVVPMCKPKATSQRRKMAYFAPVSAIKIFFSF